MSLIWAHCLFQLYQLCTLPRDGPSTINFEGDFTWNKYNPFHYFFLVLENCRILAFPAPFFFIDKRLVNHTVGTETVADIEICKLHCYYEHNCVSVNYRVSTKTCELNNATHRWHDNEFVDKNDYLYHGADVSFFLKFGPLTLSPLPPPPPSSASPCLFPLLLLTLFAHLFSLSLPLLLLLIHLLRILFLQLLLLYSSSSSHKKQNSIAIAYNPSTGNIFHFLCFSVSLLRMPVMSSIV